MKNNYLFPNKYKKMGWGLLIPSTIIGLYMIVTDLEPSFLDFRVPSIFIDNTFSEHNSFIGSVDNNMLNEIIGVLIIIGALLVAFSKEKLEDEYITKVRMESLVWAVYINYAILILSFIFFYDLSFLWVMIFNMYTVLFIFIIMFYYQIYKSKNDTYHEE